MGKNKHKHEKYKHSHEYEGGGGVGGGGMVMSPPNPGGGPLGVPKLIVKLGSDLTPDRVSSPGGEHYPQQEHHQQFHYHHRHKEKKKKKKKEKKKREDKDRDREHRHHHKKKKKREYDSGDGDISQSSQQLYGQQQPDQVPGGHLVGGVPGGHHVGGGGGDGGPPCKLAKLESDSESVGSGVGMMSSPKREMPARSCASTLKQKSTMFCKVLEHLLAMLERKDVSNFFSQPVSDTFAPGYSQIIREPMDFSTMNEKIEEVQYENLGQFRRDFELICTNCMVYNTSETVYHKAAKRLLQQGQRILAPDRIRALAEHIPVIQELTPEQLGFDIRTEQPAEMTLEDEKDISRVIEEIRGSVHRRRPPAGRFEAIPDNMTPDEIASQARGAARLVADRLQRRRPGSQMGYLRQKPDGTTSLAIVTPASTADAALGGEKTVTLGQLIGRVKNGASTLQGFKEDRRNCVKAFNPIYYGAFSSYGPAYDSTFANLTKQETELVYGTYGDDVGVAYAESIKNFSKNCEYATFIVDHLLDILTGNEHKKTSKYIEEQKTMRSEESLVKAAFESSEKGGSAGAANSVVGSEQSSIDFDSLRTLSKEGIDMSFLESIQTEYNKVQVSAGVRLEKNAALLESLRDVQHQRLSGPPPQHLGQVTGPSAEECAISDRVQHNLAQLVAETRPKDVFVQGGRS